MPVAEPGCPALWRQGLRKTGISLVPKKLMVRHWCAPTLFSHLTCALTKVLGPPSLTALGDANGTSLWLILTHQPYLVTDAPSCSCVCVASVFCLAVSHFCDRPKAYT